MKNSLFAFVAILLATLVSSGAYAQNGINIEVVEKSKDATKMDIAVTPEKDKAVNMNTISLKAVKDFSKSYKAANNVNWYKVHDGFNAMFTSNGTSNLIYYNKKGQWVGSLKVYTEDKFDHDVRDIVKREYYDYKITSIKEIETLDTHGQPVYIVHVEDDNNFKLIRVRDGIMDIYQEYKK